MKKHSYLKRISLLSLLCAGGLIVFVVENLFPPLFVPGAKLGLSNVFVLFSVVALGNFDGLILVVVKSVLGCLMTGNIGALMYSLPGGILSCAVGIILLSIKKQKISLTAISVCSAVVNNVLQNAIFCAVAKTSYAFAYLPYLLITATIGGTIVGITTTLIIKKIPLSVCNFLQPGKYKEEQFGTEER